MNHLLFLAHALPKYRLIIQYDKATKGITRAEQEFEVGDIGSQEVESVTVKARE